MVVAHTISLVHTPNTQSSHAGAYMSCWKHAAGLPVTPVHRAAKATPIKVPDVSIYALCYCIVHYTSLRRVQHSILAEQASQKPQPAIERLVRKGMRG
jgi:hypothetical protein